jgi:hypothetical protein
MHRRSRVVLFLLLGFISLTSLQSRADTAAPSSGGAVRTYYIAADIVTPGTTHRLK